MKKILVCMMFLVTFILGCDPINSTSGQKSLLPVAVQTGNCPVCEECKVCDTQKIYFYQISCQERGYEESSITIFKITHSSGDIDYIGKVNHEDTTFKITSTHHNFCYCYVYLTSDGKIKYNSYDGSGEKTIKDTNWILVE